MVLRPREVCPLIRPMMFTITTMMMMMMMMMMIMRPQSVYSRPQDAGIFENVASQGLTMAGNMAEMVGNAGMFSKDMGFDMPFAKANSQTQMGTGAALRNNDDDDDDDDDSSEEVRRKRFADLLHMEDALKGQESLLALPHLHRDKRTPCHNGAGGGTGGGGDVPSDDEDIDVAEERRRRANARRKAIARKKANSSRKRKLIDDDEDNAVDVVALTRRKRQSELDDLNQNMPAATDDLSQHAQKIAEKLSNVWNNLVNSMNEMTEKLKVYFSGQQNTTSAMEI